MMIGGRDAGFRLTPDYSKSAADAYTDTITRHTEYLKRLDLLPTVEFHSQKLPSWVPNWEIPRKSAPLVGITWPQDIRR